MLARHYPPAVSGGARRPWMMAKSLRQIGHKVFVVAPSLDRGEFGIAVAHPHRDPPQPKGAAEAKNNFATAMRNFARNWLLWPDPDIRWARSALAQAKNEMSRIHFEPDGVITTSPPESLHVMGREIRKIYNIPWICDFRDQWFTRTFRAERHNPLRRNLEKYYAKRMLANVDGYCAVNRFILDELKAFTPGDAKKAIIPHIAPPMQKPVELPEETINIVHTGSFSLSDPSCRIEDLVSAFENAAQQNNDIRLHLVGRLSGNEEEVVRRSPQKERIVLHGILSLRQALAFQAAADALVAVTSSEAPVPPGKFAEYQVQSVPIIPISGTLWASEFGLDGSDPSTQMKLLRKRSVRAEIDRATELARMEGWAHSICQLFP